MTQPVIIMDATNILRRAMDMRVTDRMDRDGKDVEPVSYAAGAINATAAALELLAEVGAEAGVVVAVTKESPHINHALIAHEIERTDP